MGEGLKRARKATKETRKSSPELISALNILLNYPNKKVNPMTNPENPVNTAERSAVVECFMQLRQEDRYFMPDANVVDHLLQYVAALEDENKHNALMKDTWYDIAKKSCDKLDVINATASDKRVTELEELLSEWYRLNSEGKISVTDQAYGVVTKTAETLSCVS